MDNLSANVCFKVTVLPSVVSDYTEIQNSNNECNKSNWDCARNRYNIELTALHEYVLIIARFTLNFTNMCTVYSADERSRQPTKLLSILVLLHETTGDDMPT